MFNKLMVITLVVAGVFLSYTANATTVNYNEAINGDLSDTTLTTFSFDIGINKISGAFRLLSQYDSNE